MLRGDCRGSDLLSGPGLVPPAAGPGGGGDARAAGGRGRRPGRPARGPGGVRDLGRVRRASWSPTPARQPGCWCWNCPSTPRRRCASAYEMAAVKVHQPDRLAERVIDAGRRTVGWICAAFGLLDVPDAAIIPVSRGAMGQIWRLDLGADRFAVKELFWDADEESARNEAELTAHWKRLASGCLPACPARAGVSSPGCPPIPAAAGGGSTGGLTACRWTWPTQPSPPGSAAF
jgi:hypothetical protein